MNPRTYLHPDVRSLAMRLLVCLFVGMALTAPGDDQFIQGYATAILEQQFKAKTGSLHVTNGVITLNAADLGEADREKIVSVLKEIRGVTRVEVSDANEMPASPQLWGAKSGPGVELGETKPEGGKLLPDGRLFEPVLADPHWPHFSMAYQRYVNDDELEDVAAVNLGATVGIYESDFIVGGRWQIGMQGNVSAFFDLDAPSSDLVNADYLLGVPLTYRAGIFSAMLRTFHQSSHLGDEFLLRTSTNRVNLSYEAADGLLSFDLFKETVRIYGGGGYIFRKDPKDLKPWSAQGGIELRSPCAFFGEVVRPIAGVDVRSREETDWDIDVSVRAGLQFETEKLRGRYLQILAEYYNGHSPHGQFFERNIEYWGIGLHFYFD